MTPNRVMDPADLTDPQFVEVCGMIHHMMGSNHRHRPQHPGAPCYGGGTFIHGTKHWEYPWTLVAASLLGSAGESPEDVAVLDVGSWGSALPPFLCSLGYRVVAMDVQAMPTGEGLYRKYLESGQLRAIVHDITRPPPLAQKFDVITCVCVLEHIRDHVQALRVMRDLLSPGGVLALTIEYAPPTGCHGSRREWPDPEMQFNEATVPRMVAAAGLVPVGPVSYAPPQPWPQYLASIPAAFPDSAPVGVLGLLLEAAPHPPSL